MDAHIDHDSARLDHIGLEPERLADGGDDDVGLFEVVCGVGGAAVADRHRGIDAFLEQQESQAFANNAGPAKDDDIFSGP